MIRSPINRTSPRETRRLELKADDLWARVILSLTGNRCAKCGRLGCQAAHILPRSHKHWRHHPKNGIPLCPRHHSEADQNQTLFHSWLLTNHPDRWAMLAYRHEDRGPVKAWMLREWIKELKSLLTRASIC
jgi:hypothetical protein